MTVMAARSERQPSNEDRPYLIDWQRRRLTAKTLNPTHCVHRSRLIEWCGDCARCLDMIFDGLL